jgi:hypothetical protein
MSDFAEDRECCSPGCRTSVPAELETEVLCVPHFLVTSESTCTAIRKETMPGRSNSPRRTEIEEYVATSAVKLARLGTGTLRLSDETKKRILTTFLTLMIVRENLDRDSKAFAPRPRVSQSETPLELAAALS